MILGQSGNISLKADCDIYDWGIVTDVSFGQLANAPGLIFVTEVGIFSVLRLAQLLKAPCAIEVTDLGIDIASILEHPLKVPSPIVVTDEGRSSAFTSMPFRKRRGLLSKGFDVGEANEILHQAARSEISTFFRRRQLSKAFTPIEVTEAGRDTETRWLQPVKA